MPVHQFLPDFAPGDAIGNHVLQVRKLLEGYGPSEIYVERADVTLSSITRNYRDYRPVAGDVIIYHASIGTPIAHYVKNLDVPLIVDYHNVTPMHFFAPYEPRVATLLYSGRAECEALSSKAALAIADSHYSASELKEMGYPRTSVSPVFLDLDSYETEPDHSLLASLGAGKKGTDVLFVGRLSPQKRQEDLIKAFKTLKTYFDPHARLFLAGKSSSAGYERVLREFVARLGLQDVYFTGGLSFKELLAYFRNADVYLSLSEHEGFGVPLIEAMKLGIPVLGYACTAVEETIGDAGILFHRKSYEEIAAVVHEAGNDSALRGRLIQAGHARAESFRADNHHDAFRRSVESVAS